MISYCDTTTCRMSSLVRYFGDLEDKQQRCEVCDFCDAASMVAQQLRPANDAEREKIERILEALKFTSSVATGRLFTETFADGSLERHDFEDLLAAIARAGLIELIEASFEKDGKRIAYRKASITPAGKEEGVSAEVSLAQGVEAGTSAKKRKRTTHKEAAKTPVDEQAEKALREWRAKEAKRNGIPAFRILTDRALAAIAQRMPRSNGELLDIQGVGQKIVENFAAQIFRVLGVK